MSRLLRSWPIVMLMVWVKVRSESPYLFPDCYPCECFPNSTKPRVANCSGRGLGSVDKIHVPYTVSELLLQNNQINILYNRDFENYTSLLKLDLSNNAIEKIIGIPFSSQTNLTYLNLESNEITFSDLQQNGSVFQQLTELTVLRLNGNNLSMTDGVYPARIFSPLKSLEELYLDGLSNAVFGEGFSDLKNLRKVSLSGRHGNSNIGNIKSSSFTHISHISNLDISFCKISSIDPTALNPLTSLQILNISGNKIGFDKFGLATSGLKFSNISVLKANSIVKKSSCNFIQTSHVKHLSNTSLKELYVDDNYIANIHAGVLRMLPKTLRYISAKKHRLDCGPYVEDLKYLTGLQQIDLSGQSFFSSKSTDFIADEDDEEEGCLQYHDSYTNCTEYLYNSRLITLPPNLKIIHSNFTQSCLVIGSMKFQAQSVNYLDLSSNLIQFQTGTLKGFTNVTKLDVSDNLVRKFSVTFFRDMHSVESIDMSDNLFGWQLKKKKFFGMFWNLRRLKTLKMHYSGLSSVHGEIFQDLHSLVTLNLAYNEIYNFSPDLKTLTKLEHIDLSVNQIRWLKYWIMKDISHLKEKSPNLTVSLRDNPLRCFCDNLMTLKWLLTSGVTPENMTGYVCYQQGFKRRDITDKSDFHYLVTSLENECHSVAGLAVGCAAFVMLALLLTFCGVIYRFRWKLRYIYTGARLKYKKIVKLEDDGAYMYDAFISYADEDRAFVINDIRGHLEHEENLVLNIHHRDFMPGEPIASNIVSAIKHSRKTVILLSTEFLKSYWCRFELHMAQMESVSSGRDIILLVMYRPVPSKDIPGDILNLLHKDTYLMYPEDSQSQQVFWRLLLRSVKPNSDGN